MKKRPRLLIVKVGTAAPVITERHGDYEQWFIDTMGAPERFDVIHAYKSEPLPARLAHDGVIVTGSPLSACDPLPWMSSAGERLREWAERGEAVLGVCFGHQLMSHAFGTPVIKNPSGREIGTVVVELTEAGRSDPLFEGLGDTLQVQTTHTDIASALPASTTLLASNNHAAVQAARFGERARGLQFHPELASETLRTLIQSRQEIMAREGLDGEAIALRVTTTPVGPEILRRFEERLVG